MFLCNFIEERLKSEPILFLTIILMKIPIFCLFTTRVQVLPFCLLNVGNIFLASYVKRNYLDQYGVGISLSAFNSSLTIVISFLSVTRVRIAFDQFVKHRAAIQKMARARYDEYSLILLD